MLTLKSNSIQVNTEMCTLAWGCDQSLETISLSQVNFRSEGEKDL